MPHAIGTVVKKNLLPLDPQTNVVSSLSTLRTTKVFLKQAPSRLRLRKHLIPEGSPHYDTTYRHAEVIRLDDGRLARLGDKGPNVVLADGHVEKRINLSGGPWNDDNFNLPVN